jgi:glycosyltransferase involved in cell wall biosynthesis
MDQGLPKVSVLMPAYNYGRYVGEALESALAQDYPADRFEVIVVDDGSTDDTDGIVRDLADRNPGRIRLISQPNSGRIAAMARARAAADGSLLALLDADDVWLASKLRRQVEVLRGRPEVGLVFCDMHTIDGDGELINTTQYQQEAFDVSRLYARILRSNLVYTSSLMVRAELFLEPPEVIDDWDWWLTLCAAERGEVGYIAEPLALYRWHGDNRLLGADGAKLVGLRRRQLQFQLWTFRHMDLTSLSAEELWSAWGGAEWFAETAVQATGSHFLSLVSVTDAEREQARARTDQAQSERACGDLLSEARLRLQALAWDPSAPEAFTQFRDAVARALALRAQ